MADKWLSLMRAMRGVASSTHCGRKPLQVPSEKTTSIVLYVVLLLLRNIAIGQLKLQLSHYSLVAFQAFFAFRNVTSEGASRGPQEKNFLCSLSLAILSGPLIHYAIIRPLQASHVTGSINTYCFINILVNQWQISIVNIDRLISTMPSSDWVTFHMVNIWLSYW